MTAPVEAGAHLGEITGTARKPRKAAVADNTLWRTLEASWGRPYDHNRFVFTCLLARRIFCPEASPKSVITDLRLTYETLLTHSVAYTRHAWCTLLMKILHDEVRACRMINEGVAVEAIYTPRKKAHFTFDIKRWFPTITGARQKVQARLLALRAARACRVSPLLYLWENDLVKFVIFPLDCLSEKD